MEIIFIIRYQSSKFSFLCVSLMESLSREIVEIRLSPSHQHARWTMDYSPVNNKQQLWTAETRDCLANDIVYRVKIDVFFRKLIKYFMYFRMKFALFFRFFDSWYIIKYLLTEPSVLWTLDRRYFPRLRLWKHQQSRVHKTYCFPWSQSISVK